MVARILLFNHVIFTQISWKSEVDLAWMRINVTHFKFPDIGRIFIGADPWEKRAKCSPVSIVQLVIL